MRKPRVRVEYFNGVSQMDISERFPHADTYLFYITEFCSASNARIMNEIMDSDANWYLIAQSRGWWYRCYYTLLNATVYLIFNETEKGVKESELTWEQSRLCISQISVYKSEFLYHISLKRMFILIRYYVIVNIILCIISERIVFEIHHNKLTIS